MYYDDMFHDFKAIVALFSVELIYPIFFSSLKWNPYGVIMIYLPGDVHWILAFNLGSNPYPFSLRVLDGIKCVIGAHTLKILQD